MAFDIRSARIVLACAQAGSIGAAARRLDMAQPAVTRALTRLEATLQAPLFDRTTRGVVPTPYGAALLPHAELLVSEAAQAEETIRQMRGAGRGVIRVGGVGSVASGLLVAAIARIRQDRPGLSFVLVEALEDSLLEGLKSGRVDLAVSPEPYLDDDVRLAADETFRDRVGPFVRPEHPAAGRAPSLAEAATFDWAMPPPETPVARQWRDRFHAHGLTPAAPCLVSRSVAAVKAAAATADIACWMPEPLVRAERALGHLVPLAIPALEWRRTFRIYRRRRGLLPPGAEPLLAALRREAATG